MKGDAAAFGQWIGNKQCKDSWFKYDDKTNKWYVHLHGHLTSKQLYALYCKQSAKAINK